MDAQLFLDLPIPIRYRAITDTKPYSQNKPTCCSSANDDEMCLARTLPDPAKQVEAYDHEMNNDQQQVEQL